MSTANVNNNQLITHCRWAIFGSNLGKDLRPENFVFMDRKAPALSQPGPSHYSEVSARKRADESSRVINSIDDSASSIDIPALLIGSISSSIVRKGRTLGYHRTVTEFTVQSLVYE